MIPYGYHKSLPIDIGNVKIALRQMHMSLYGQKKTNCLRLHLRQSLLHLFTRTCCSRIKLMKTLVIPVGTGTFISHRRRMQWSHMLLDRRFHLGGYSPASQKPRSIQLIREQGIVKRFVTGHHLPFCPYKGICIITRRYQRALSDR